MPTSHRFQILEQRDINKETFVEPWPEAGLIVADSPADPQPSLRLEGGQVVELDGRARADFDMLDFFIADHGLDLAVTEAVMATPSLAIARRLVDVSPPQTGIQRPAGGCSPAQLGDFVK